MKLKHKPNVRTRTILKSRARKLQFSDFLTLRADLVRLKGLKGSKRSKRLFKKIVEMSDNRFSIINGSCNNNLRKILSPRSHARTPLKNEHYFFLETAKVSLKLFEGPFNT